MRCPANKSMLLYVYAYDHLCHSLHIGCWSDSMPRGPFPKGNRPRASFPLWRICQQPNSQRFFQWPTSLLESVYCVSPWTKGTGVTLRREIQQKSFHLQDDPIHTT